MGSQLQALVHCAKQTVQSALAVDLMSLLPPTMAVHPGLPHHLPPRCHVHHYCHHLYYHHCHLLRPQ